MAITRPPTGADKTLAAGLDGQSHAVAHTELTDAVEALQAVTTWVDDNGAVGDGVTDDSAAIQALINAMDSRGGTLGFRKRFYYLGTGLTCTTKNIGLIGREAGRGQARGLGGNTSPLTVGRTTLIVANGQTGFTWGTPASYNANGPLLKNLHFTPVTTTPAVDTRALVLYQCSNALLDNCAFSDFNWSIGPFTITGTSFAGTTVTVTTSAAHGFRVGDLVQITGVVTSPTTVNGYNACWKITAVTSTTFSFTSAVTLGTWASGGAATVVSTATIFTAGQAFVGTQYMTARDCTWGSGSYLGGAWVDFANGVHFQDCIFDGANNGLPNPPPTAGVGLAVTGGDNTRLMDCDFQGWCTNKDFSGGQQHEVHGGRNECFGTGDNVVCTSVGIFGGSYTNSASGSGGTSIAANINTGHVFMPTFVAACGDITMSSVAGVNSVWWDKNKNFHIGTGSGASSATLIVQQTSGRHGLVVAKFTGTTSDLLRVNDDAGNTLGRFDKNGYFMTRKKVAPADGDLINSELAMWFDDTPGSAAVNFKGKNSGGTVVTATVPLA